MLYLKTFESVYQEKNPDWFYLVLRSRGKKGSDNESLTWESLYRMEFDGLRGISDNDKISFAWFDVRDIMLVMPSKDTIRMNDLTCIQYFNADQLISNNLELLKRIYDNEEPRNRGDQNYSYNSTLTKVFQNISYVSNKNMRSIGNRKISKIRGTWKKDGNLTHYRRLMRFMSDNRFYYTITDALSVKLSNGNKVGDMKSFMDLFFICMKESKEKLLSKKYSFDSYQEDVEYIYHHIEKYGYKYIEKILRWSLGVTGKIYNRSEGEWVVNSESFKPPKKSYLFIKVVPDAWNDTDNYDIWKSNLMKRVKEKDPKRVSSAESRGMTKEKASEFIEHYKLDQKYNIRFVSHSYEMNDILKKEFSNNYKMFESMISKTIDYRVENIDCYSGQSNMELGCYIDDNIIGMVEYVLFDDELTISDITVVPKYRRMGFGSRMIEYLKQYHSNYKYIPSYKTDLGSKFKHKTDWDDINKVNIKENI